MIIEMIPELVSSQTQLQKIKNSFHIMQKKFGRLEKITSVKIEPLPIEMYKELEYIKNTDNILIFENRIVAHFEKADVKLVIISIKKENRWMLSGVKLQEDI